MSNLVFIVPVNGDFVGITERDLIWAFQIERQTD